jgi:hypothetical protein
VKKYILTIAKFSILLLVPILFIVVIDPYNYVNISRLIDYETKVKVMNGSVQSFTRGNMLWKVLEFRRKPCPNLIIGDSNGFHIREQMVSELSSEEFFNLSISGANIQTQITLFWFAAERIKLRKVFLQLTFELSSQHSSYDLFHFAQDYIEKPYLYFTNKEIFIDSFRNLVTKISKNSTCVDHSYLVGSREEKIEDINSSNVRFLKNYTYPSEYMAELKKISEYCSDNDIHLSFIFFPTSNLGNENIARYNLVEVRDRFYDEIASIAFAYNFLFDYRNFPDTIYFSDFAHTSQHVTDSICSKIFLPVSRDDWKDSKLSFINE